MTAVRARPADSSQLFPLQSSDHIPVLLHEAVEALAVHPGGLYVDATYGRGGHSALLLQALGPSGRLIAFDRDPQAVAAAKQIHDARFEIVHAPFSELVDRLRERGIEHIDGLLADLGVSSPQLEQADRGFSFRLSGPLDMRMDPTRGEPVSDWLSRVSQQDLQKVIADYGEERFAFQIAGAITARCAAAARGEADPLDNTAALATLVAETLKRCGARRDPSQHPATRTFQALRIHINRELEELSSLLQAAVQLLCESGRIAIISFHSLEDRIVKQFFREHAASVAASSGRLSRGQRALIAGLEHHRGKELRTPTLRIISRIRPRSDELDRNPRARSATLRVAQRCGRAARQADR